MHWLLVFVVVFLPAGSIADLTNPHLPWRTLLDEELEARGKQKVLCKLPPYPKNGGYVVVDKPDAKPGDLFQDVSIVQYKSDNKDTDIVIEALHCNAGEWSRSVFKYQSEELYFNSTWCPSLCSSFNYSNNAKELSPKSTIVSKTVETKPKVCILPPYPPRGGYFLEGVPDAKPGDVHKLVNKFTTYELLEDDVMYKINSLACNTGTWYRKIIKFDHNMFRFVKATWCPLVCASLAATKDRASSEPSANTLNAQEKSGVTANCRVPPYPEEGNYTVVNSPEAKPNDVFHALHLKYSCYSNKKIVGSQSVYCVDGVWSNELPRCVRCGSVISALGEKKNSEVDLRNELPWHISVYTKVYTPYKQICSGSIVATNFIVTAAHCFWSEEKGVLLAAEFAVAAGKIYRDWDNPRDALAQKSDVEEIRISPKFRGFMNGFRDNIALLLLKTTLVYSDHVSPVCIDFDVEFEEQQLTDGSFGKIASWNPNDKKDESSILQVGWLPYVDRDTCFAGSSSGFREYITSDKICAGDNSGGTGLCARDAGAGLAFQVRHEDATKVNFYLRGIASVTVNSGDICNTVSLNTFTHVLQHENFLKNNFKDAIW